MSENTSKIAIFPGSFDPITEGHVEIAVRGLSLFDKVIVAVGVNSQKKYLFSLEDRMKMLQETFATYPNIEIAQYQELTVSFAQKKQAKFVLRGLRTPADMEYEQPIALLNQHLFPEIETVCLFSKPQYAHISSTIVREIIKYGGNTQGLVPQAVIRHIEAAKNA